MEDYLKTKEKYRELLLKLLATRSAFTKKLKIDMPSTLHTNDRFPSNEDKVVEKKVMKKKF